MVVKQLKFLTVNKERVIYSFFIKEGQILQILCKYPEELSSIILAFFVHSLAKQVTGR